MSILICYDGSASARHAVENAAAVMSSAELPVNDITLFHVWKQPTTPADSFDYRDDPHAPSEQRLVDFAQERARELVDEGAQLALEHGLRPNTLLARNTSSVTETILQVADAQDAALIVLGAHTHGTPGPTLQSVSTDVVARSSRPVLVIPMSTPSDGRAEAKVGSISL